MSLRQNICSDDDDDDDIHVHISKTGHEADVETLTFAKTVNITLKKRTICTPFSSCWKDFY